MFIAKEHFVNAMEQRNKAAHFKIIVYRKKLNNNKPNQTQPSRTQKH